MQALRTANKAALQKWLVAEMASKLSMLEAASQLRMIQAMMPQQIQVKKTRGKPAGRSSPAGGRAGKVWKVAKDSWGDDW